MSPKSPDESSSAPTNGRREYVTCNFTKRVTVVLIVCATILCPVAIALFAWLASALRPIYSVPHLVFGPGQGSLVFAWIGGVILVIAILTVGILFLHELCHGLAFRWAGARPRYGAKMLHKIVPIFYAAAPGFRMPCRKFRAVLLAPTVVVHLLGIGAMWMPTPLRYLLIFPLGIHFAGCLGDWWMLNVLRGVPGDTLVEDTPEGFRFARIAQ